MYDKTQAEELAELRESVNVQMVIIVVLAGLLLVCLLAFQEPSTIQAQYTDMSAEQRSEFMVWAITPEMQYQIAEDFCRLNPRTKRVCFNAAKSSKCDGA